MRRLRSPESRCVATPFARQLDTAGRRPHHRGHPEIAAVSFPIPGPQETDRSDTAGALKEAGSDQFHTAAKERDLVAAELAAVGFELSAQGRHVVDGVGGDGALADLR